jgi:hypothetical protein
MSRWPGPCSLHDPRRVHLHCNAVCIDCGQQAPGYQMALGGTAVLVGQQIRREPSPCSPLDPRRVHLHCVHTSCIGYVTYTMSRGSSCHSVMLTHECALW